jgi:hypothetical protein
LARCRQHLRARRFLQMRVRVLDRGARYVETAIYRDDYLDGLGRLFTYEPTERWAIDKDGRVHAHEGIGP